MTTRLCIIITLVAFCSATTADGLEAADRAVLAQHVLTEDELNRLTAALQDLRSHGADVSVKLTGSESIAMVTAKVDALPGVRARLASHGFTSRDYIIAILTTLRAAMMSQMSGSAGGPNIAFSRAHARQINQLFGSDAASVSGSAPLSSSGRDPVPMNPEALRECTKVSLGTVALIPLTLPGSVSVSPEDRRRMADALRSMVPKVSEQTLKDDFNDLSNEIRRQAAAPRFSPTPRASRALNDLKGWLQTHCTVQK